jgi:predicted Fe-Mo cluster-binding NifX family protein
MKIAIPSKDGRKVAGHAGQARHWLVYDSDGIDAAPERLELDGPQVLHYWQDDGPHPLDDVDVMIATSAGDAFVRRMAKRGVRVILTAERDATRAARAVRDGEELPKPPFNPHLLLCKIRDLFSKH